MKVVSGVWLFVRAVFLSRDVYDALPDALIVRELRYRVGRRGLGE